jgi:hypothetical protein
MWRIGKHEIIPNSNMDAMHPYNKMHAGYMVQVEQGIGGLEKKRKRLMKRFDNTKPRYSHLFKFGTLLINFMHRRRMDLTYEVIDNHLPNPKDHGWARDF